MSADNDLRDAMIAAINDLESGRDWEDHASPEEIADAILAILSRWTALEPE